MFETFSIFVFPMSSSETLSPADDKKKSFASQSRPVPASLKNTVNSEYLSPSWNIINECEGESDAEPGSVPCSTCDTQLTNISLVAPIVSLEVLFTQANTEGFCALDWRDP